MKNETYLNYLKDVLGVREFLNSEAPLSAIQERETELIPLVTFICPDKAKWSPEVQELFQKMMLAMKLESSEFRVDSQDVEGAETIRVHCLGQGLLPQNSETEFFIYSPTKLFTQPKEKAQAWKTLQEVMKKIGKL